MAKRQIRTTNVIPWLVAGMAIGCLAGMPWWPPLKRWHHNMVAMIPVWNPDDEIRIIDLIPHIMAVTWILMWGAAGAAAKFAGWMGVFLPFLETAIGIGISLVLGSIDPRFILGMPILAVGGAVLGDAVALDPGRRVRSRKGASEASRSAASQNSGVG